MLRRCVTIGQACIVVTVAGCTANMRTGTTSARLDGSWIPPASNACVSSCLGRTEIGVLDDEPLSVALRRLRPEWLRTHPLSRELGSGSLPSVYVDGMYVGGLDVLESIASRQTWEVRSLSPFDARGVLGVGCRCAAGVILVKTRGED
jgi:hypothetical protein